MEGIFSALIFYKIIKKPYPLFIYRRKNSEDWRLAHIIGDYGTIPDPVLFWRPIAKHPFNSQRFKGPTAIIPKPQDVFRIMCYGDSNTEGSDVSWPEELQKIFDKHHKHQYKYEVLHAGYRGYSSYQGLLRFKEEVSIYKPNLVFVSFGWNDLPLAIGYPDKKFHPPNTILVYLERLLLRYNFYQILKNYARELRQPFLPGRFSKPRVSLSDYIINLNEFLEIGKKYGITVIFLTRPHLEELAKSKGWRKNVPLYNQKLREFTWNKKASIFDIQKIFSSHQDLFRDECHFNYNGSKKMAESIYNKLLENNYLPQ